MGALVMAPSKSEVLVYYASETALKGQAQLNTQELVRRLNEMQKATIVLDDAQREAIERLSTKLSHDSVAFKSFVKSEVDFLVGAICGKPNSRTGLIVFSNELLQQNQLRACLPGQPELMPTQIAERSEGLFARFLTTLSERGARDFRLDSSPLSAPESLDEALSLVEKLFPSSQFEYALILKGHGNAATVLTPRVTLQVDASLSSERLTTIALGDYWAWGLVARTRVTLARFARPLVGDSVGAWIGGTSSELEKRAEMDKQATLDKSAILDKSATLDKHGTLEKGGTMGTDGVASTEGLPPVGIPKKELLNILQQRHQPMHFGLVFLEACQSEFASEQRVALGSAARPNIGVVFVSDDAGLNYNTLNYEPLRGQVFSGDTGLVRQWLSRALRSMVGR
jgi:hypothetical protein